jgi:indole-3-glycerol phosphate synthase
MNDRLAALYAAKALATAEDMAREPLDVVVERGLARKAERRSFRGALDHAKRIGIIAEMKRASPSVGLIAPDFDPASIASRYESAGVDAISVLTEASGFLGDISYLDIARSNCTKPILRKDFLTLPYEIAQASAYGADAVLLIVAGLTNVQMRELLLEAERFALDALVEVHTAEEIDRALAVGAKIIGINNRNLRTFEVDLKTTEELAPLIPSDCCIITESGIQSAEHIERALAVGARAALIGEAVMRSADVTTFLNDLYAPSRAQ